MLLVRASGSSGPSFSREFACSLPMDLPHLRRSDHPRRARRLTGKLAHYVQFLHTLQQEEKHQQPLHHEVHEEVWWLRTGAVSKSVVFFLSVHLSSANFTVCYTTITDWGHGDRWLSSGHWRWWRLMIAFIIGEQSGWYMLLIKLYNKHKSARISLITVFFLLGSSEQDANTSLQQTERNPEPMDTNASETAALALPCLTLATAWDLTPSCWVCLHVNQTLKDPSIKGPQNESFVSSSLSGGLLDGVQFFIGEVPLFESSAGTFIGSETNQVDAVCWAQCLAPCFKSFIYFFHSKYLNWCMSFKNNDNWNILHFYIPFLFVSFFLPPHRNSLAHQKSFPCFLFQEALYKNSESYIRCTQAAIRGVITILVFFFLCCRNWNSSWPSNMGKKQQHWFLLTKCFLNCLE